MVIWRCQVSHLLGEAIFRGNKETKPHSLRCLISALFISSVDISQQTPREIRIKEFSRKWPIALILSHYHIKCQISLENVLGRDIPLALLTPFTQPQPDLHRREPVSCYEEEISQQYGCGLVNSGMHCRGRLKTKSFLEVIIKTNRIGSHFSQVI